MAQMVAQSAPASASTHIDTVYTHARWFTHMLT